MKAQASKLSNQPKAPACTGPSLFEVEYLRQLKEELRVFLQSRSFSTIQEIQVGFVGSDYTGMMQVKA